jgi:hypothetical protein
MKPKQKPINQTEYVFSEKLWYADYSTRIRLSESYLEAQFLVNEFHDLHFIGTLSRRETCHNNAFLRCDLLIACEHDIGERAKLVRGCKTLQ